MKRIFTVIWVLVVSACLCGTVYAQSAMERQPHNWTNKNKFSSTVILEKDVDLGTNANITSSGGRYLDPQNHIRNSLLGVWSTGASIYNTGTTSANVPDGWYNPTTNLGNVGVSKVLLTDVAFGSGGSVYPTFPYSMQIDARNKHTTGAGVTGYFAYPGDSGVSTAALWYRKFSGKRVVFGAYVWRDTGQYTASGVSTHFIRPFIRTSSSGGNVDINCAFGDYQETNGWQLVSAVTDVPTKATALEVGFALNPTVLAPIAGDTAFICAPFLLIDPARVDYVSAPREIVYFSSPVEFNTNGPGNDKGTGTSSYTVFNETSGRVPQDVDAYYVAVQGQITADLTQMQLRTDTAHRVGVTHYPVYAAAGGATRYTIHQWIPADYNGDFDFYTSSAVNGISVFVTGAQYK